MLIYKLQAFFDQKSFEIWERGGRAINRQIVIFVAASPR